MKRQHLVPLFILALAVPGYASAGFGVSQKGACNCSHVQKVAQKSSPCRCGAVQKHTQKSSGKSCGCAVAQKGKGHVIAQKGHAIHQKSHVIAQKGAIQKGIFQKDVFKRGVFQKGHTQKGAVQKGVGQKSGGGCSTCCLSVIPAVLNGVDTILTNTAGHIAAVFACDSCGHSGKSKSKGCSCHGSSKIGLPGIPPNPFEDDVLLAPPAPSTEANNRVIRRPTRVTRRPIHRQVTQAAPVVRVEPRALVVSATQPIQPAKPIVIPVVRTVSAGARTTPTPYNPLRAK